MKGFIVLSQPGRDRKKERKKETKRWGYSRLRGGFRFISSAFGLWGVLFLVDGVAWRCVGYNGFFWRFFSWIDGGK